MAPLLPSRYPNKLTPRSDFRNEQFRKLVASHGLRVTWEQAAPCPCSMAGVEFVGASSTLTAALSLNSADGNNTEARADCPLCQGSGVLYHSSQEIRAIFTRATAQVDAFRAYGLYERHTAAFTFLPEHLPGYQDRLTLIDSAIRFQEIRTRGAGTVDTLRAPVFTRTLDLSTGPKDIGVLHLHKAQSDGQVVAGGALDPETHSTVTAEGALDWSPGLALGTAPAQGERYSVTYTARPRYVVTGHPHTLRDTWVKVKKPAPTHQALLVQADAVLEFFFGDGGGES